MGVYIQDKKLVIIAQPKTIRFNLTKKIDSNLKHDFGHIIKHIEFLAEQRIKSEIDQLLFKYKHENDIHEQEK